MRLNRFSGRFISAFDNYSWRIYREGLWEFWEVHKGVTAIAKSGNGSNINGVNPVYPLYFQYLLIHRLIYSKHLPFYQE